MANEIHDYLVKRAAEVHEALFLSINHVPSIRFATGQLISAIEQVTEYQVVPLVVDSDRDDLRGSLWVFESPQAFANWLEKNPEYKSQTPDINYQAKGVGLVLLNSKENQCWRRFTVIKEASHFLFESSFLDAPTDIKSLAKAVVEMPSLTSSGSIDEHQAELFLRDYTGIAAAIELLMPESIRPNLAHSVNVKSQSAYQIAKNLMLPEKFVELRLRQWELIKS